MKFAAIILSFIFLLQPFFLNAQQTTRPNIRPAVLPASQKKKWDDYITLGDKEGRPFKNENPGVDGSPYFIDEFKYANVVLSNGTVYDSLKIKIDLYRQEIHVIDKFQKEMITVDGLVKNILLTDTLKNDLIFYKFQSGFPDIDKNNIYSFYQVLSDGNIQLLKSSKKEIVETKDVMSGEVKKEFVKYDEYYVINYGIMLKLKKDKEFVLDLFDDEKEKISEYLKNRKMNYKNIGMLTDLFSYYNSLKPAGF